MILTIKKKEKKMIEKMTQSYRTELYPFEKFECIEPEEIVSMEAIFELTRAIEPVKEKTKESRSLKISQKLLKKLKFNPRIHEGVIPIESVKLRTYNMIPQVY